MATKGYPQTQAEKEGLAILLRGSELTPEQKQILVWRGAKDAGAEEWIKCHSFYFTPDGKTLYREEGYSYPVCNSLKFLPH